MGSTLPSEACAPRPLRTLRAAVYAPLPTFFNDDEELDLDSCKTHLLNLATKGVVPVCAGSLGEASHLDRSERITLIKYLRACLDGAGLQNTPIVAGVGGNCTRETIRLAQDAASAGADAGMVIPPGYYAASLKSDEQQLVQYFVDVCEGSPIPILLYNFPANSAGIDLSSSCIEVILRKSPKLAGVKLTCGGSIAKLMRLQAVLEREPFLNAQRPFPFLFLDGLIADLEPWVHCGGHGTVSGMSNFAPLTCVKLLQLCNLPNPTKQKRQQISRLHTALSVADVEAVPLGVRGMKYVLHKLRQYGNKPRRPLLPLDAIAGDAFLTALPEVLEIEQELNAKLQAP